LYHLSPASISYSVYRNLVGFKKCRTNQSTHFEFYEAEYRCIGVLQEEFFADLDHLAAAAYLHGGRKQELRTQYFISKSAATY
jgi:hypothetical protein